MEPMLEGEIRHERLFRSEARALRVDVGIQALALKVGARTRLHFLDRGFDRLVGAVRRANRERMDVDSKQWTLFLNNHGVLPSSHVVVFPPQSVNQSINQSINQSTSSSSSSSSSSRTGRKRRPPAFRVLSRHARTHANLDLQAWYHSTFASELYRPRGSFWWKEAILPEYSAHPMTPPSKRASPEGGDAAGESTTPTEALCSPQTIYTAMAATMYTIRATLGERDYALFEQLTTDGVMVLKHPFRPGSKAQRKRFQLSLVQGESYLFMYLTWKGKHGTQGVELASVDEVMALLVQVRLTAAAGGPRVSLLMPDRCLELGYEAEGDAELWCKCFAELVRIETDVRAASRLEDSRLPPPPPSPMTPTSSDATAPPPSPQTPGLPPATTEAKLVSPPL